MPLPDLPLARDIMATRLVTFSPDLDLYDAVDQMLAKRISGAPVVENGQLVGLLSEKDCLKVVAQGAMHHDHAARVRHFMSTDVETIRDDLDLISIAGLFLKRNFRRFPVVDHGGALVGQVSRRDVLHGIQQMHAREKGPDYGIKSAPGLTPTPVKKRTGS